jgi:hypothetical protein
MQKIWKAIEHNRYLVSAIVLLVVMTAATVALIGCASKTPSLVDGQPVPREVFVRQVNQQEAGFAARRTDIEAALAAFNADVEAFNRNAASAIEHLDRQDAIRAQITNTIGDAVLSAVSGNLNPAGAVVGLLSVAGIALGAGAAADNRRKDSVIENLKQKKDKSA